MKDFHKSLLKTAVAIIILVLLALYAYFVEHKKAEEEAVKKEAEAKVLSIKKEDISRLKITHRDGKPVELEREGEKFVIKAPISSETD